MKIWSRNPPNLVGAEPSKSTESQGLRVSVQRFALLGRSVSPLSPRPTRCSSFLMFVCFGLRLRGKRFAILGSWVRVQRFARPERGVFHFDLEFRGWRLALRFLGLRV